MLVNRRDLKFEPKLGILEKGEKIVFIAMDPGSTTTRTLRYTESGEEGTLIEVPSELSYIPNDVDVKYLSNKLEDKLAIRIISKTNKSLSAIDGVIKIAKGSYHTAIGGVNRKISSTSGKLKQDNTYINVLSNIAFMLAIEYNEKESYPENTVVDLAIAFPPGELSSKSKSDIIEKLRGEYEVEFLGYEGMKFNFVLREERLLVEGEANAISFYDIATMPEEDLLDENEVVLYIDGGGCSIDMALLDGNTILSKGNKSAQFGGSNRLITEIQESYHKATGYSAPPEEYVERALENGLLKDGRSYIDIVEHINNAKDKLADDIHNEAIVCIESARKTKRIVGRVNCAGRLFNETINDGEVVSKSLVEFVREKYQKDAPNTEFRWLQGTDIIPKGLALYRLSM